MEMGSAEQGLIERRTATDDVRDRLARSVNRRAGLLNRQGVRSVALVGSFARGDAKSDSDIDLLFELSPGATFDLIDLVTLKEDLAAELGRDVDILFKGALRPYVAKAVARDARRLL